MEGAPLVFQGDSMWEVGLPPFSFYILHVSLLICVKGGKDGPRGLSHVGWIYSPLLFARFPFTVAFYFSGTDEWDGFGGMGIAREKIDIHHPVNRR